MFAAGAGKGARGSAAAAAGVEVGCLRARAQPHDRLWGSQGALGAAGAKSEWRLLKLLVVSGWVREGLHFA